ncbi:MAG: hydantoinase/oxoprolinase N-terminal domain-containing protein, partial [Actinophytocola sp.]|uniref:hydantoinase/oxoprolinase N-terminal domain-containing protein n=1 Tax=Actinophytocola sp. TaxID=1872138 RepID=UPI003C76625E
MPDPTPPATGYRLGIALDGDEVAGALVDAQGTVVAVKTLRLAGRQTTDATLTAVLDPLLAHLAADDGRTVEDIDRVLFAISEVDDLVVDPGADSDPPGAWTGGHGLVAVVRLGAATTAVPPLALWPPKFRDRVVLASTCVTGGARLDGTELEPLDEAGLADFARTVAGKVEAVAVTGVFATLTPDHEQTAAVLLERELGDTVRIVLSHEIGGTGLLERENATVLQAVMTPAASRDAERLQNVLAAHGLGHAEVFFARNDGTIMAIDYAATHPLALYGGAAAATVRGTAQLAGEQDALVALTRADGTALSICAVTAGLPRLTSGHTTIAGVPTSLRLVAQVPVRPRDETPRDSRALVEAIDRAKTAPADLPLLLGGPGAEDLAASLPPHLPGTVGVRCPPWATAAAAV